MKEKVKVERNTTDQKSEGARHYPGSPLGESPWTISLQTQPLQNKRLELTEFFMSPFHAISLRAKVHTYLHRIWLHHRHNMW